MEIGFHLTPFWSPTDRHPTAILDEAVEVVRAVSGMGFAWVSIGHHWVSHPTVWPQPMPVLARLAPETGDLRLKTSMLLLPLLNPVDVAENVVTLDHITHGRLDLGVAIGYREKELEAAGLTRKDRVPKLEESLDLMKRLWRGDEVTFDGAYTKLTKVRLGFPPCQRPHPPLEMGAQSVGATRRAARLVDTVFFGPQVSWADVGRLVKVYREARMTEGPGTPGRAVASRSLIVGASKEAAHAAAKAYL
jgi:alkanesulfonate monooxygenase SsuD/methylene tetrahydromethanopterin reductase-like flavin-dependent oxidoreductase (luciferase family)